MTSWTWRLAAFAAAAAGVTVSALPDPGRPVLVVAALALAAGGAASVTGWRAAGSAAVTLLTAVILLAGVLEPSGLRPVQLLIGAALLLVLLRALEGSEELPGGRTTLLRAPAATRLGPTALALAATIPVSVTAAEDVVPSVQLVLVGMAAAVAALVLATRPHRHHDEDPHVRQSLPSRPPTRGGR